MKPPRYATLIEADITIQGRPGIVIMFTPGAAESGTTTAPKFHSLELLRSGEFAESSHLRDLPKALKKARG